MSTKSTIHSDPQERFHLEEEMIGETAHLVIPNPDEFVLSRYSGRWSVLDLTLTPAMIDAIAAAHNANKFPHQRRLLAGLSETPEPPKHLAGGGS